MKLLVITKKKAHNLKTRYILIICYRPSISDLSGLNTTTHIYFNVFVDLNNCCKKHFFFVKW